MQAISFILFLKILACENIYDCDLLEPGAAGSVLLP